MKAAIAVVCQKGGVGKSTTALNMGAGLSLKGQKVLFVDLDAQGNLTETLGADGRAATALDVLLGATAASAIQHLPKADILPAGPGLAGADMTVIGTRKEYRLKDALASVQGEYDYIVIDTPPSLGVLTVNALTAATEAVVPAQADIYSLRAIGQLSMTMDAVREHCNPRLSISGIVLTRHNNRAILSRDMADMIEQTARALQTKVFKASIREAIVVKESQARQQDIFTYAPRSGAARDYHDFINEYLAKG